MRELNSRVVHVCGLTEIYGPITVCPEQEVDLPLSGQVCRALFDGGLAQGPSSDWSGSSTSR